MKRIWIAGAAFIIIIGLCITEIYMMNHIIDNLQNYISKAQEAALCGDMQGSLLMTEKAEESWKTDHKTLALLIGHDQLEPIDQSVATMHSYAESEEDSEFLAESAKISAHLEHIKHTEFPTISNIL